MERLPIENEELLPEDANQVEVYYQEPQSPALEFEKKGKNKNHQGGGKRKDSSGQSDVSLEASRYTETPELDPGPVHVGLRRSYQLQPGDSIAGFAPSVDPRGRRAPFRMPEGWPGL